MVYLTASLSAAGAPFDPLGKHEICRYLYGFKQLIQSNCIDKIAKVTHMLQAKCCNQGVVNRRLLWKSFSQDPLSSYKSKMALLICCELIIIELDLTHVYYVVPSFNDKVDLGSFCIISTFFRPYRLIGADTADSKCGFYLLYIRICVYVNYF